MCAGDACRAMRGDENYNSFVIAEKKIALCDANVQRLDISQKNDDSRIADIRKKVYTYSCFLYIYLKCGNKTYADISPPYTHMGELYIYEAYSVKV